VSISCTVLKLADSKSTRNRYVSDVAGKRTDDEHQPPTQNNKKKVNRATTPFLPPHRIEAVSRESLAVM
jgi:hypothetical protein